MPRTELTLFAGTGEEVYLYSTIGATSVGGMSELFIPILIAALIVMNTMLGSVYERVREIGVFNAVGLAPSHSAI
jgi:ABC-type antimicrobial peptide transport system permease subunit